MRSKESTRRKKWIRKGYILTSFVIAFLSAALWWHWNSGKKWTTEGILRGELLVVGIIYCVVYWFFAKMYQAQKIGVYRITELVYFQLLSFGMTDIVMLLASVLWFREISGKQVFTCFLVLIVKIILSVVCVAVFHKM